MPYLTIDHFFAHMLCDVATYPVDLKVVSGDPVF